MDFLNILLGLVYVVLVVFFIYLIYFLREFLKSIKKIELKIGETSEEIKPVLEKLNSSLEQISQLTKRVEFEIAEIHNSISAFTETAKDYKRLKDKIVSVIEEPVDELQSTSKAFITGLRVFIRTLFNRNH